MTTSPSHSAQSRAASLLLCVILLLGIFLRIWSDEAFRGVGYDENLYVRYVEQIKETGVLNYPKIVERYIEDQKAYPHAFLPPTRVTFLLSATGWHYLSGFSVLESIRGISTIASIVILIVGALFAWRLGGPRLSLGISSLMAFAPMQIYMAHRALIDGFFAMVALLVFWSLWETLKKPESIKWRVFYGVSLALMVLTKENAAFVYVAILGVLAVFALLKLQPVGKALLYTTFFGPLAGVILLMLFGGGLDNILTAFLLNVKKSYAIPYVIQMGDGPWFRYIIDLLLVAPAVTLLAIAGLFRPHKDDSFAWYSLIFFVISFIIMGHLRYGLSLRYSLIWDFPLRYFAMLVLVAFCSVFKQTRQQNLALALALVSVVALDFLNYRDLFVDHAIYDPMSKPLMQALKMVK